LILLTILVLPSGAFGGVKGEENDSEQIDDGRRTMSRLPANIGRGFIGVFQRESVKPFLIGAAATGLSTLLDDEVRDAIADEDDAAAEFADDNLGPTGLGLITLGLFIGGRYSGDQRFRDASYDLGVAFTVNLGFTWALKEIVGRERPNGSNDESFPSGHTSNAFALASVADAHYGKNVGIPAYALASLIGLSRLRSNAHWLSDVVAGASLGHLVGRAVVRQNDEPLDTQMITLGGIGMMPSVRPGFKGVVMGMNF
jgi:hypothetical protein